jgi:ATP synthase protein I
LSQQFSADLVSKTLQSQAIATLVVALVVFVAFGQHAALSVLIGGFVVLVGTFIGTRITKKGSTLKTGGAVLVNLLKAEAVKIGIILLGLWLAFNYYSNLVPLALIAGLASGAIFSAVALSKIKI